MTEKMSGHPKRVHRILDQAPDRLQQITAQARTLQKAEQHLQSVLPARLQSQWSLAALNQQQLVVVTTSAAWGTLLRGHQRNLLNAAEALIGQKPQSFKLRIVAPSAQQTKGSAPQMSDATIDYLETAANGMADPRLQEALSKLAAHGRRFREEN
ncbi:DUF721 domain-containing protein [Spiribacter sp. C176]|uniref:DUF721 domain-containing protein n=1 Tax=Spiribacter salilacus TaxID=2664894 RepID=A0A6N7QSW1_9GAMM|nr:DciA family protein [Spiribacter salilacus]MRH78680.1 DUF721 domain-containing protein [Spiribacter salilacus]